MSAVLMEGRPGAGGCFYVEAPLLHLSALDAFPPRDGRSYTAWLLDGLREAHDACGPGLKRERLEQRARFVAAQLIGRFA